MYPNNIKRILNHPWFYIILFIGVILYSITPALSSREVRIHYSETLQGFTTENSWLLPVVLNLSYTDIIGVYESPYLRSFNPNSILTAEEIYDTRKSHLTIIRGGTLSSEYTPQRYPYMISCSFFVNVSRIVLTEENIQQVWDPMYERWFDAAHPTHLGWYGMWNGSDYQQDIYQPVNFVLASELYGLNVWQVRISSDYVNHQTTSAFGKGYSKRAITLAYIGEEGIILLLVHYSLFTRHL